MTAAQAQHDGLWRALAILFLATSLVLAGLLVRRDRATSEEDEEAELRDPELVLEVASFDEVPGWSEASYEDFLTAFGRSCESFSRQPADHSLGADGWAGRVGDWQPICDVLASSEDGPGETRGILEDGLRPWRASNGDQELGLLTGYYEPTLRGSREPDGIYNVPLYRKPQELVTIELGRFRDDLRGRRLAGQVRDGRLDPFHSRSELEGGALRGRGLELAWVDDAIDAFFLQIQGSGRVVLEDGGFLRVGYDGQNGHPYFAIGRELVERGELLLEDVSMQSIRAWLVDHPDQAAELMQANASFVFFRELHEDGPVGSQGVVLTPNGSIAVDRSFIPLGVPIWLDTARPDVDPLQPDHTLQRLFVAQDTGGAIRGPLRGDVFWGHGQESAAIAGRMRHEGRFWLLLPKAIDPR